MAVPNEEFPPQKTSCRCENFEGFCVFIFIFGGNVESGFGRGRCAGLETPAPASTFEDLATRRGAMAITMGLGALVLLRAPA